MRLIKLILIISIALLAQACETTNATPSSQVHVDYKPLSATSAQRQVDKQVVQRLQSEHYQPLNINDAYSRQFLEDYLNKLDSRHQIFLASDIARFKSAYGTTLDNELKDGSLKAAFDIFNTYQKRRIQIDQWLLQKIDAGIDKLDLDTDQTLKVKRKHADWPADKQARRTLWTKILTNQVINERLNDVDTKKIQKQLRDRYTNTLKRLAQAEPIDVVGSYLDTYTHSYDPHTAYFTPHRAEDFKIDMKLSLQGIGALLRMDNGYPKLVRLVPGGPAAKSGKLHPTDRIIAVAQGKKDSFTNVIGMRLDETVRLIRGEKGTTVRLKIMQDNGGSTHVVSLVRDKIHLKDRAARKRLLTIKQDGKTYKIGVIRLPSFYRGTSRDVHKLLKQLKAEHVDGIVMDLRNNGGGALREATHLTGLFMPTAASVQVRDASGDIQVLGNTNNGPVYNGPLIVMVNRLSASATEIFTGAIQDYGRGLIVGSQTYGKGTVQTLMPLSKGQLKLTEGKFYRVSGASTQDFGVTPDIDLPSTIDPDDVGEATRPHALPWDKIAATSYPHSNKLRKLIPELRYRHAARVINNPDFQYRIKQIALVAQRSKQKTLSLNLDQRRKRRKQHHKDVLALANAHREATDKKPFADYDAFEDHEDKDNKDTNGNPKPYAERKPDAYQNEASHIMADMVQLLAKDKADSSR